MKAETVILLMLSSGAALYAQADAHVPPVPGDTLSLHENVPAPSQTWVPEDFISDIASFKRGKGAPVDTLDVGDGRLQIVLFDDYSWCYIKNMEKIGESAVFTEHWKENVINPYDDISLKDLAYRNSICLVDSMSVFVCPHPGKVYSRFGYRRGRRHQGTDVPLPTGTPLSAAFDGRVRFAARSSGYGNLVIIRHENGLETFYGHLSRINVEPGDWVRAGDIIGLAGSTGRSSGPHLHFETRYMGYAFDPEWIVDFEKGELRKNVFVLRKSYLDPSSRYVHASIDEEEEIYATDEQIIQEEMRIEAERAAMRWHSVRSGETLSGIAAKYGKSLSAIRKLNPGINADKLRIGQKIRVN